MHKLRDKHSDSPPSGRFSHMRDHVEKMLTYALTRPIGYADHPTVDAVTESVQRDEYRMRSLIHAVVASELFQSK